MKRAFLRAAWFIGGCFTAYGIVLIVAGTFVVKIGEALQHIDFWEEV